MNLLNLFGTDHQTHRTKREFTPSLGRLEGRELCTLSKGIVLTGAVVVASPITVSTTVPTKASTIISSDDGKTAVATSGDTSKASTTIVKDSGSVVANQYSSTTKSSG